MWSHSVNSGEEAQISVTRGTEQLVIVTRSGIHQSFLDEKLEMILSLDFLQFTVHNHDSGKSTTRKHDPEILTESCFCLAGILNLNENVKNLN